MSTGVPSVHGDGTWPHQDLAQWLEVQERTAQDLAALYERPTAPPAHDPHVCYLCMSPALAEWIEAQTARAIDDLLREMGDHGHPEVFTKPEPLRLATALSTRCNVIVPGT